MQHQKNLQWKQIEDIIGVSYETLRKAYKRKVEGLTCSQANPNNYAIQKIRGLSRKYQFVLDKGGKCECCGYNNNISALEFHHIDPNTKSFQLDLRAFSNTSLEKLKNEVLKCKLLCANCHREYHNPTLTIDNISELIKYAENKKSFSNQKEYGSVCPICGKSFFKMKGKIYCSEECRWKAKGYPSIEEVNEQYEILENWEKVAQHFGLTRKIIQGIRKRNS